MGDRYQKIHVCSTAFLELTHLGNGLILKKCYDASRIYGFCEQVTLFSCVHFVNALVIQLKPNPNPYDHHFEKNLY